MMRRPTCFMVIFYLTNTKLTRDIYNLRYVFLLGYGQGRWEGGGICRGGEYWRGERGQLNFRIPIHSP